MQIGIGLCGQVVPQLVEEPLVGDDDDVLATLDSGVIRCTAWAMSDSVPKTESSCLGLSSRDSGQKR